MTGFFIFIHTIFALLLIACILMQSGRGGGLTEGFASAESMFGAKTNEFMVRSTVVLASLFLVTSLSLAYLSSQKEQSLISLDEKVTSTVPVPLKVEETANGVVNVGDPPDVLTPSESQEQEAGTDPQ